MEKTDDAGVYKVSEDLAIIQTVDFFTPIVDDPYWFGQIAAANALSDIYAMGGVPKTAMNLVAFPLKKIDISILGQVIQGGIDKMKEADVVLLGGHSIQDSELKYGLSVTGFGHPDKFLTKRHLKAKDLLILTKPIGTGIIAAAIKAGLASQEMIDEVIRIMAQLNRGAAEIMANYRVHACTDITGFGLIGHLAEMIEDSKFGVFLEVNKIPIIKGTLEKASMGLIPGGCYKNREFRQEMIEFAPSVDSLVRNILFDPQTSGGLLMSVSPREAEALLNELIEKGHKNAAIIGEVVREPSQKIVIG